MNGDLLSLFIEHENAISKLYEAYAKKFLTESEFWATLSWEEKDHAKKLHELSELIENGHARFDSVKFKPVVIQTSLKYIAKEIVNAERGDVSLENALSIALNIEKAQIDGQIFDAFVGFTAEAKSLIRELVTSFNDHYQTIQKTWSEHRKFSR